MSGAANRNAWAVIGREFRSLYKAIEDTSRRLANMHMTGRVAEIDGMKVRLDLAPLGSDRPFLSPWVQLQDAAGSTASHFPVTVGDPMRLFSPHGELGPQSIAIRDSHTDDKANPASDMDELAIVHAGCELRMSEGELLLRKGTTSLRLNANGIFEAADLRNTNGGRMTHNNTNIGDTHVHPGVLPGGAKTQTPV